MVSHCHHFLLCEGQLEPLLLSLPSTVPETQLHSSFCQNQNSPVYHILHANRRSSWLGLAEMLCDTITIVEQKKMPKFTGAISTRKAHDDMIHWKERWYFPLFCYSQRTNSWGQRQGGFKVSAVQLWEPLAPRGPWQAEKVAKSLPKMIVLLRLE